MTQTTVWGSIDLNGNIVVTGNSDFKVESANGGQFQISFNPVFTSTPVIVGSQNNFGYLEESNTDSVCFPVVTSSYFQVNTGTASGDLTNRTFAFIAIGNR